VHGGREAAQPHNVALCVQRAEEERAVYSMQDSRTGHTRN